MTTKCVLSIVPETLSTKTVKELKISKKILKIARNLKYKVQSRECLYVNLKIHVDLTYGNFCIQGQRPQKIISRSFFYILDML